MSRLTDNSYIVPINVDDNFIGFYWFESQFIFFPHFHKRRPDRKS